MHLKSLTDHLTQFAAVFLGTRSSEGDGPEEGQPKQPGAQPLKRKPMRATPVDTPYEYAFPFTGYTGESGSMATVLRARQQLKYGDVLSKELLADDAPDTPDAPQPREPSV